MLGKVKALVLKASHSYKSLPEKKQYIEFFTAVLSVPVLLTVILLNVNNLRAEKQKDKTPQPTPVRQVIYVSPQNNDSDSNPALPTQLPSAECNKEMPEVSIETPQENETVTDNPVSVIIRQEKGNFCAVVWSYRLNGGKWSEYDDKSLALYNLQSGNITLELKVKSIVTGEEKTSKRMFIYTPTETTPVASGSAS